jgi:hypothetical protein
MSVWLTSVVRVLDLPPACKSVLREFCDYANVDFMGWPGTDSLSATTGYCERTVQGHLRQLEQNGILERIPGKFTYRGQVVETVVRRVDLDVAIRDFGIDPRLKLPKHWRAGAKCINDLAIPQQSKVLVDNDGEVLVPYAAPLRVNSRRWKKTATQKDWKEGDSEVGESPAVPKRISCTQTIRNLKKPNSDAVGTSEDPDARPMAESVSDTPVGGICHTPDPSKGQGVTERSNTACKRTACKLWQKHQERIKRGLGEPFWTSWLSILQPENDDGEMLVLSAPNGFVRDWLRSNGIVQVGKIEKILGRRVRLVAGHSRRPKEKGNGA